MWFLSHLRKSGKVCWSSPKQEVFKKDCIQLQPSTEQDVSSFFFCHQSRRAHGRQLPREQNPDVFFRRFFMNQTRCRWRNPSGSSRKNKRLRHVQKQTAEKPFLRWRRSGALFFHLSCSTFLPLFLLPVLFLDLDGLDYVSIDL